MAVHGVPKGINYEGLERELIYEEQNAQFYIDKGINSGFALRFVRRLW